MDEELKAKWVAALRSGEFRQTIGTLRRADDKDFCYCCLGVLYTVDTGSCPQRCTPDSAALERWHMDESVRVTFELMNDGGLDDNGVPWARRSFAEIADWIEKNL